MQPACDHQMQNDVEIVLEADDDALPNTLDSEDTLRTRFPVTAPSGGSTVRTRKGWPIRARSSVSPAMRRSRHSI